MIASLEAMTDLLQSHSSLRERVSSLDILKDLKAHRRASAPIWGAHVQLAYTRLLKAVSRT